jgi:hypothetical protein
MAAVDKEQVNRTIEKVRYGFASLVTPRIRLNQPQRLPIPTRPRITLFQPAKQPRLRVIVNRKELRVVSRNLTPQPKAATRFAANL